MLDARPTQPFQWKWAPSAFAASIEFEIFLASIISPLAITKHWLYTKYKS